jgi:AMMECR1 domain-containing protein
MIHPYVRLARLTVERLLSGEALPASGEIAENDIELWSKDRACFVSIKTLTGTLRGCIGTILPTQGSLGQEIIANAVSASTRDPRFNPMTARTRPVGLGRHSQPRTAARCTSAGPGGNRHR